MCVDNTDWVIFGLGSLDLTSAQNISHMNSNTELVLEIKEKQDLMVV